VPVPSGPDGLVDVEALEALVDDDVAGLMLTNPNTLGLFERDIARIAAAIHRVDGYVYYDGANLNAIMGHTRPGDMGFDIVHINTHKTFATPHGGGGPGAGPVGVIGELVPFLPVPRVERDGDGFVVVEDDPRSIGRVHGYHGNVGILVRAYTYLLLHGRDGLREVSDRAVLNANYLAALVRDVFPLAYPDTAPMHEFVATAAPLEHETGIRAVDVAKRMSLASGGGPIQHLARGNTVHRPLNGFQPPDILRRFAARDSLRINGGLSCKPLPTHLHTPVSSSPKTNTSD